MISEKHKGMYKLTYENRDILLKAKKCVCVYCGAEFDVSEIEFWQPDPNNLTAQCPHCWIDAVLPKEINGKEITKEDVKKMFEYYFGI